MEPPHGTLHTIARHLVLALQPLKTAVADLSAFRTMLYRLAWDVKSLPPEYTALTAQVDQALAALDGLGDDPTPAQIFNVLNAVRGLYTALNGITNAPEGVDAAEFLPEFGRSLFELLLEDYLNAAFPSLHSALLTLDILARRFVEATAGRPGVLLTRFQWEEVPKLLTDPGSIPARVYGWGTDDLDFHRLAGHLMEFFVALNWPAYIGRVDRELGRGFKDLLDDSATSIDWGLKIPVLLDNIGGKEIEVGLALLELPAQGGKPAGLILQPMVPAAIGASLDLTDELRLELRPGSDVATTFGVLLRPGDISVKFPFQEGAALPEAGFGVTLRYVPERPALLLGTPGKSRLEFKGAAAGFNLDLRDGQLELRLEAEPQEMKLIIAAADLDGFLREMLGGHDMTVLLPLSVRWSNKSGLGFVGGAGFEVSWPANLRIGPLTVQQLNFALTASQASGQAPKLMLQAGASLGGQIGPVGFSVDNIGLQLACRFADGNAGPFDIALGFKPPNGLGLAIDASSVAGGGFLFFDPDKGEYAGMLQLEIAERINVKAFGLLTTQLPDGAKGYSLIVFITAEDFQPIQLGMGFKLQGIGGMLAINRTFNEAAMREGLKNDTLGTLLFPRDPIRNAPEILRNLATVFPARLGSYLFGPMAKIGWATPTLIQMDLALILEIGARRRLIVLGRISSILPSREKDLIRLNMDAMGVFDFDVGTISMDAVLVDSRLLQKFVLTGSMAMRACLVPGPRAGFALAVGGMNPHYSPPVSMPRLDRITINLTSGDNPRFTCDAYFAVTPNTIQFGSRSTMYAAAYGFSIVGDVGFDVLVQLLPFHFLADFYASIQLKRGSRNLFKVKVVGALEGPRPLRVSAKATFEILWCDFSIRFDKTLIGGEQPAAPPAVNALDELKRVLSAPDGWNADLPAARRHGVTVRKLPGNATLTLDPLGELMVRQSVLPLNTSRDLDVFGGAPLTGARRFTITAATLNTTTQSVRPVRDLFAPAQFFDLSDDDKLASPSFEEMDSGIVFGSDAVVFDESTTQRVYAPLEYETIIIDEAGEVAPAAPYVLGANRLQQQVRFASVAKAGVRNTGLARFRNTATAPAVSVVTPGWIIASTTDLNVLAPDASVGMSWGDARVALEEVRRSQSDAGARWQVIPAYEVVP